MFKDVLRRFFAFATAASKCIQNIDEALQALPGASDPVPEPGSAVGPEHKFDHAALGWLEEAKRLIESVINQRSGNPTENLQRAAELLDKARHQTDKRGVSLDIALDQMRAMKKAAGVK